MPMPTARAGRQRSRIMYAALATVALALLFLAGMARYQAADIADAVNAREAEAVRQYARFCARELAYQVSTEEGAVLSIPDLESMPALIDSLEAIEWTFDGLSAFAVLENGSFLYPAAVVATVPAVDATSPEGPFREDADPEFLSNIASRVTLWLQQLGDDGTARLHVTDTKPPMIVSLRRFWTPDSAGLIGIGWSRAHVAEWRRRTSLSALPQGYLMEIVAANGDMLAEAPGDDSVPGAPADRKFAVCALQADCFPWSVRVGPKDPGALQVMVRRQVSLYVGVLSLLCLLIAAGVWTLAALTLREMELGRMKSDFAANVSHELRTPLALIRASADALHMRPALDDAQKKRYLGIIRRESRRLTDLVNTVLRFSRIERHSAAYHREQTDLRRLVQTFIEDYRLNLEEEGFALRIDLPDRPLPACVDASALQLVLVNLLDNAVKFSQERREVAIAAREQGAEIAISVRDKGIGLAPEDREKVFDVFYRAEASAVKKTRGTGIGLALVREIVAYHGGRVTIDSAPGQGATFTVWLPRATAVKGST